MTLRRQDVFPELAEHVAARVVLAEEIGSAVAINGVPRATDLGAVLPDRLGEVAGIVGVVGLGIRVRLDFVDPGLHRVNGTLLPVVITGPDSEEILAVRAALSMSLGFGLCNLIVNTYGVGEVAAVGALLREGGEGVVPLEVAHLVVAAMGVVGVDNGRLELRRVGSGSSGTLSRSSDLSDWGSDRQGREEECRSGADLEGRHDD